MPLSDKAFQYAPFLTSQTYLTVPVNFDRESLEALKTLLRAKTAQPRVAAEETATARRDREALLRVYDQIRDTKYCNP